MRFQSSWLLFKFPFPFVSFSVDEDLRVFLFVSPRNSWFFSSGLFLAPPIAFFSGGATNFHISSFILHDQALIFSYHTLLLILFTFSYILTPFHFLSDSFASSFHLIYFSIYPALYKFFLFLLSNLFLTLSISSPTHSTISHACQANLISDWIQSSPHSFAFSESPYTAH